MDIQSNPNCKTAIINLININQDTKKATQRETIGKIFGNYASPENLEFAARLFINLHKQGRASYNTYTEIREISNKINNNQLLNQKENIQLKNALIKYLSQSVSNTLKYLEILEHEIIDSN